MIVAGLWRSGCSESCGEAEGVVLALLLLCCDVDNGAAAVADSDCTAPPDAAAAADVAPLPVTGKEGNGLIAAGELTCGGEDEAACDGLEGVTAAAVDADPAVENEPEPERGWW